MAYEGNLAIIASEGQRVIDSARRDPAAPVPHYPAWTLRDLVIHLAGVHGRTAAVCQTLAQERLPTPSLADGANVFDWADQMLSDVVGALRSVDPEAPLWSFSSDRTAASWERRMLIETGVHRWDAQSASEGAVPLLDAVAISGLDEFSEAYLARLGDVQPLELRDPDLGRSWRFGGEAPARSVEDSASAMYLRLMSRPGARLPDDWEAAVDALAAPSDYQAAVDAS